MKIGGDHKTKQQFRHLPPQSIHTQPRLLGLQNIQLFTSDASSAEVDLDYVPVSLNLGDQIRKCVEDCRSRKNVRMMDVVEEHPGDAPHGN